VAVTSIDQAECLQCALQSDSFTEINKQPERKTNLLFTLLKVQGLRKKKQSQLHPVQLWRSPSFFFFF